MIGFTSEDVSPSGTNLAGATVSVSGGPRVYAINVDGLAGSGTLSAAIAAGAASDVVGNRNTASTSSDNSVSFDIGSPPVTDSTPPVITPNVSGTLGTNDWYASDVSVSWGVSDAESAISSQSGCEPQSVASDTSGLSFTCAASSGGGSSSQSVSVKRDATLPTISAAASSAPNANDWYNGDVVVAFSCQDELSGIPSGTCPAPQTLIGEGANISSSAKTVKDAAGNTSAPSNVVTVQIDRSAPSVSLTGVTNGASYTLGAVPTAACSTSDDLSKVATQATLSLNGGNADGTGSVTATCASASDKAGNVAPSASVSYSVGYNFSGFSGPVDNPPMVNTASAGRNIPLKWRLIDASGNPITTLSDVTVSSAAGGCSASAPADSVEEYASSPSGLQNLGNGYYQFNWKTEKSWAGSCRTLKLDLGGGQLVTALFLFR